MLELNLQPDSIEQIRIERLRKVQVQNLKGQLRDQGWMRTQSLKNLRCESACDVVFEEFGFLHVRIAGSLMQLISILKLPDSVVGEPLKRILCVTGFSLWAILNEQRTQLTIYLGIWQ